MERYTEMGVKLYADLFLSIVNRMEVVSSHEIIFCLFVRCGRRCCVYSIDTEVFWFWRGSVGIGASVGFRGANPVAEACSLVNCSLPY